MMTPVPSRRQFVKQFTLSTAASVVLGRIWSAPVLAESTPTTESLPGTFQIRVSEYPALAGPFGSVRLGVNAVRQEAEPFPDGDYWPILINRAENGGFFVLDAECQHASCVVPIYDESEGGIRCPCHGSAYDLDGSIINGPTERPLRRFPFEFDGTDLLTIHVPGLGFRTVANVLPGGAKSRLRLCFQTHYGITYQVSYRAQLTDPWQVIPFALNADGPLDNNSLLAEGIPATLFVERTSVTGFYGVSMLLAEV